MKALKYTLIIIATLGLIASFYNAWHDHSLIELAKGLVPSAILFYLATNIRGANKQI